MKSVFRLLPVLLLLVLSSCMRLYGIQSSKKYSAQNAKQVEQKLGFESAGALDSNYETRLRSVEGSDSIGQDYMQPLQFWYYENGRLSLAEVNCYAGGFPNLHWHFAKGSSEMTTAGYLNLEQHARLLGVPEEKMPLKKNVAIVVWSQLMGRQNTRFINEVKKFLKAHPETEVFYFNTDLLLIESE